VPRASLISNTKTKVICPSVVVASVAGSGARRTELLAVALFGSSPGQRQQSADAFSQSGVFKGSVHMRVTPARSASRKEKEGDAGNARTLT
jgi:hypothetical protein